MAAYRQSVSNAIAANKAGNPMSAFDQRAAFTAAMDKAKAQDAANKAAATAAQAAAKPTIKKKGRWGIVWEGESDCFVSLEYANGVVEAEFIGPAAGTWTYPLSRKQAVEWLIENGDAPGEYFNDEIRE